MRIAIVGLVLNTHSGARAPIEIALALQRRGHTVAFFATPTNLDTSIELTSYLAKTPWGLYRHLTAFSPDIISTHTTLSYMLACKLTAIPIVGHYYGTQFNPVSERFLSRPILEHVGNLLLNPIIFGVSWLLAQLPNHMVAISSYCAHELQHLYYRSSDVVYLGGPITTPISKRFQLPLRLLTVSRITPYKNFHGLINLVNSLPPSQFTYTIIGSSPSFRYLAYLRSIAKSHIRILVNPTDAKLYSHYRRAAIYLNADKYLFFGLPIVEASTFGIPTLSLPYAAATELVVHNRTGYICSSIADFKLYLTKLSKYPKLWSRLSKSSRQYSLSFNWDRCATQLEKLYSVYVHK